MADTTPDGATAVVTGTRLRCPRCSSEAIVTQSGDAALRCCDGPLDVVFAGR